MTSGRVIILIRGSKCIGSTVYPRICTVNFNFMPMEKAFYMSFHSIFTADAQRMDKIRHMDMFCTSLCE